MNPTPPLPPTQTATAAGSSLTATPVAPATARRRPIRTLARHFWRLEGWKKALLILALLMGVVGIAGSVAGYFQPDPPAQVVAKARVEDLVGQSHRSSLTAEQKEQINTQITQAADQVRAAGHWFYDKTAPFLWRVGLGFAIAFVLGYMARQFVKTVAVIIALLLILGGVAVYLGKLDGTKLSTDLRSGAGWVAERSTWIKEQMVAVATTSLSGTAGFVIGFLRRQR